MEVAAVVTVHNTKMEVIKQVQNHNALYVKSFTLAYVATRESLSVVNAVDLDTIPKIVTATKSYQIVQRKKICVQALCFMLVMLPV